MPRKARNIIAEQFYHITSRGNNRKQIFFTTEDYMSYLQLFDKYREKYNVSVYHYCLMTNHTHFLLQGHHDNHAISRMMHALQTAYAVRFNRNRNITGHFFENRFKHVHITQQSHLLECGRYIERNPIRAGMVQSAHDYPWSSYRYYAGMETKKFLSPNPLYQNLSDCPNERIQIYAEYVSIERAYETIIDQFFDERVLI